MTNEEELHLIKETSDFLHSVYDKIMKQEVAILEQRRKLEAIAVQDSKIYVQRIKTLQTSL